MKKALTVPLAAVLLLSLAACTKTQQGAVIGGAVGAGAGYAIGDANGDHGREGAIIGGVVRASTTSARRSRARRPTLEAKNER